MIASSLSPTPVPRLVFFAQWTTDLLLKNVEGQSSWLAEGFVLEVQRKLAGGLAEIRYGQVHGYVLNGVDWTKPGWRTIARSWQFTVISSAHTLGHLLEYHGNVMFLTQASQTADVAIQIFHKLFPRAHSLDRQAPENMSAVMQESRSPRRDTDAGDLAAMLEPYVSAATALV